MQPAIRHNPAWTAIVPADGLLALAVSAAMPGLVLVQALLVAGLFGSVIAAVHHAEVIAHKVGEPYGTLVLALAVTAIEVALIVSMMLSGGEDTAALATLSAIVILALVLPNYTTTTAGPTYTPAQLGFIAVATLVLFAAFTLFQTVRHRDYFLPVDDTDAAAEHAAPPTRGETSASIILLLVALVVVVLSAKLLAPAMESALDRAGAPRGVVGILIAALVLLPEGVAAIRAAVANRVQTSLNLAMGSAIASIGLTIPTVAVVALAMGWPLALGLDHKSTVLLALTLFVSSISLRTGRTNLQLGIVHVVLFVAYLFMSVLP